MPLIGGKDTCIALLEEPKPLKSQGQWKKKRGFNRNPRLFKKTCLCSIVLCFWPWHILMYICHYLSMSVIICQYLSISVIFPYLASHPLPNLQMKIALAASLCASGSATGYHYHHHHHQYIIITIIHNYLYCNCWDILGQLRTHMLLRIVALQSSKAVNW